MPSAPQIDRMPAHAGFGAGTDNRIDPNGTGDWTQSDNDPPGNPAPVPLQKWL